MLFFGAMTPKKRLRRTSLRATAEPERQTSQNPREQLVRCNQRITRSHHDQALRKPR